MYFVPSHILTIIAHEKIRIFITRRNLTDYRKGDISDFTLLIQTGTDMLLPVGYDSPNVDDTTLVDCTPPPPPSLLLNVRSHFVHLHVYHYHYIIPTYTHTVTGSTLLDIM